MTKGIQYAIAAVQDVLLAQSGVRYAPDNPKDLAAQAEPVLSHWLLAPTDTADAPGVVANPPLASYLVGVIAAGQRKDNHILWPNVLRTSWRWKAR